MKDHHFLTMGILMQGLSIIRADIRIPSELFMKRFSFVLRHSY